MSATLGPVSAGSLWVIFGTEVSILAAADYQDFRCLLVHLLNFHEAGLELALLRSDLLSGKAPSYSACLQ